MSDPFSKRLEELGQIVTSGSNEDPYKNFFERNFQIPANPFPPSGIADSSGDNQPLREEITNYILNFIKRGYLTRNRQFLVVRGDYGSGKTHTLRFIEHTVNTYMSKGDKAARAIYVERPRIEAQELNRAILRSLGLDTIRKYVWFAIRQTHTKWVNEDKEELVILRKALVTPRPKGRGQSSSRSLWEDDPKLYSPFNYVFGSDKIQDYRTFFAALEEQGWNREQVRTYLVQVLVAALNNQDHLDIAQAFVALLIAPDEASFNSWETLLSMTNTKAMPTLRAPSFLRFLLKIMELNGIVYVYLLLDEFEEVPQGYLLTPRQRQDYMYTLREVLNTIQSGLSIVIAISPQGLEAVASLATPLTDVNNDLVELGKIDLVEALKLIYFYIDRERQNTEFSEVKTYPLSRELIAYILTNFPKSVQLTPRNLIQFLHTLFNAAADKDLAKIETVDVDAVLTEFGATKTIRGRQTRARN